MTREKILRAVLGGLACCLLPSLAQAQGSGIAGVVRTAAGQPAAGVTVEAASPVLIEKTRSVTTDGSGQYKITDLLPGDYTVTFRGMGFSTLVNTGIELRASFTATINGVMKAGNPSEVVTVAAGSLADTRSTAQSATMTDAESRTLASGTGAQAAVSVTRGLSSTATDVGGSAGIYAAQGNSLTVRGKAGVKRLFDGLRVENAEGIGNTSYMINSAMVGSTVVETGGGSAESMSAGGAINNVPMSGSNTFSYRLSGLLSTESMQSDNLTDDLRARGLTGVQKVSTVYDGTFTVGGPIKRDKLWFFFGPKYWGNRNFASDIFWQATHDTIPTAVTGYKPVPEGGVGPAGRDRRGDQLEVSRSQALRVTWQANAKNKFNFFFDFPEAACTCRGLQLTTTPEAVGNYIFGQRNALWQLALYQATWSSARTSKLLLEAGASFASGGFPNVLQPGVTNTDISIRDTTVGFTWNDIQTAHRGLRTDATNVSDRLSERFAASYVTGSHAIKMGITAEHVWHESRNYVNYLTSAGLQYPVNYQYVRDVAGLTPTLARPNTITEFATPYADLSRVKADVGIFVQDQWTLNRLTLNYGLRYSYFKGTVPDQWAPSNNFIPFERNNQPFNATTNPGGGFSAKDCVPCWHDIDPRFGAAYDVFGNGKTVVKGSIGRYVSQQVVALATANNPFNTAINSVTRNWNDAATARSGIPGGVKTYVDEFGVTRSTIPGDYIPQCNFSAAFQSTAAGGNGECGPIANPNFGRQNDLATTYDSSVISGFGTRQYVWDTSLEVTHALTPRVTLTGGYYRNWAANFQVTDNTYLLSSGHTIGAGDFDPYCIDLPTSGIVSAGAASLGRSLGFDPGSAHRYCGLYDAKTDEVAKNTKNVVKNDQNSPFGNATQTNDFFGFSANMRLPRNIRVNVNLDTGRTVTDNCYTNLDSPAQATYDLFTANRTTGVFNYCHSEVPFSANTAFGVNGTVPIIYGIQVSGNYRNSAGVAVTAFYDAPNTTVVNPLAGGVSGLPVCSTAGVTVDCKLGRNLSNGATLASVPLIRQGDIYEARRHQFDVRFQKSQRFGRKATLTGTLGIYNIFNASDVLSMNTTYGANWLKPTKVVDPRLFQVAARVDF